MQPGWWGRVPWRRRRVLRIGTALLLLVCAAVLELRGVDTSAVIAVSRDLPAGHRLADADLTVHPLDRGLVPDGVVTDTAVVLGTRLTAPVRRGEVLTDARLADAGGNADSRRVVPIPLADPAMGALLKPGDVVDLVVSADPGDGSDPAPHPQTLARAVEVVEVPPGRVGGSATVLVGVPTQEAARVAAIAGSTPVAILVHG